MDIQTLRSNTSELTLCPVFILNGDSLSYEPCGEPLKVIHLSEVRGDDYGSWVIDQVYFQCGHTFAEMENSLRHRGEI